MSLRTVLTAVAAPLVLGPLLAVVPATAGEAPGVDEAPATSAAPATTDVPTATPAAQTPSPAAPADSPSPVPPSSGGGSSGTITITVVIPPRETVNTGSPLAKKKPRVAVTKKSTGARTVAKSAKKKAPKTSAFTRVTDTGNATLAAMPNSGGVTISWDDPLLAGHLGTVDLGNPTYIMINRSRLTRYPSRTDDVVKHEVFHIYQGRIIAANAGAYGGWRPAYDAMVSRLDAVFGGNGLEKVADCGARRMGATWTYYTKSCSGPGMQDAVTALLEGRMP